MARKGKDDYNWLDDPFDEKKAARERNQAATSTNTKIALGCGCLFVVIGSIVLIIIAAINMLDILASA